MIYFIVNKTARTGNGYSIWPVIRKILQEKDITYRAFLTEYAGHARDLAHKITSSSASSEITLIILGGDGTLNEVLNGIADFRHVRIGIIPAGSGNDFVRGMNLSRDAGKCLLRILDLLNSENSEKDDLLIDLGEVQWEENHRYFAISSGVGLDAIVCKKALTSRLKKCLNKLHIGKLTYLLLTIQTLFSMKTAKCSLNCDNTYLKEYDQLIFSASMNLRAEGGGVPMAPEAHGQDQQLTLCIAHGISKSTTFFLLPVLVMGKHQNLKCFDLQPFQTCHLTFDQPMVLHTDGEYCGDVCDVTFRCLPKALRLLDTRKI